MFNKNTRKLGLAALALVGSICLTSCGGTSGSDGSENTGNTSENISVDQGIYDTSKLADDLVKGEDGKVTFDEPITLKVWSIIGSPDDVIYKKLISQFNQEYSGMINLDVTYVGHFDFYKSLDDTYATDFDASFPDICFMHNEKTIEYAAKDYLYCLDDLFDKTTVDFDFDQVYSNIDRVTKLDGHRFAIPVDAHGFLTSFRQDIIKKNGLGFDDNGDGTNDRYTPQSRAEYQSLLTSLRTKADAGTLLTRNINKGSNHAWTKASSASFYPEFTQSTDPDGLSALYANGGTMANGQTKVNFQNSEGFQTYLTDQVNYYNGRLMGESGTNTEMFGAGNTVMFSEGPWWISETYNLSYNNSDLKKAGTLGVTEEDATDPVYNTPYVASHPQGWWTLDANKNSDTAQKWYGNGHAISLTKHITSTQKAAAALTFAKWFTQGGDFTDETNPQYNLATWANAGHLPAWKNVFASADYKSKVANNMTLSALGDPSDIIAMEGLTYETTIFTGVVNSVSAVQAALKSSTGCTTSKAIEILNQSAQSAQDALDLLNI
ncbi:MAG: hypothetical protein WCR56_00340 [Bacilli bacterium]|jgi:hypothetical protein